MQAFIQWVQGWFHSINEAREMTQSISPWTTKIAVTSLAKPGKVENEDAYRKVALENADFTCILVADGLGSTDDAALASHQVVNAVASELAQIKSAADIVLVDLFSHARKSLEALDKREDRKLDLKTTLLICVETQDCFRLGYVGNGSIWHVRGDFLENRHASIPISWNASNYLIPHSVQQDGKEALLRYLSNEGIEDLDLPTLLEIQKDRLWGDLIFVATDGVNSGDQLEFGTTPSGEFLSKMPPSIIQFFKMLKLVDLHENTYQSQAFWDAFLVTYLVRLEEQSLIHDDATIGLFVTQQFLNQLNLP